MAPNISIGQQKLVILEEEEILQYVHPSLLKVDYASRKVQGVIIIGTFIIVLALFFGSMLFCNMFSAFRSLVSKQKVFMSLAIVRAVYGVFCIVIGCYFIFKTTSLDRDIVFGKNATSTVAMCVTVGFFLFELSAVVLSDLVYKTFSKMLIMHHSLALIAFTLAVVYESNYAIGCKGLILEMSTPFSCICYLLLKAGMESSKLWTINQCVLIHTFHLRSVVECHLWYVGYQNWTEIYARMPLPIFVMMYTNLTLATFIMTPYWGYRKTQQLFNPVDWNFQESRNTDSISNGSVKKDD
ncbi:protein CLN8-like [Physella acuta]|uniref:protein CLN8-like n=1 Tax=Physella acuta TaxID=109671 RepID=UPI0027DD5BA6|nr:protein CLN8-like [Physella acuta]